MDNFFVLVALEVTLGGGCTPAYFSPCYPEQEGRFLYGADCPLWVLP